MKESKWYVWCTCTQVDGVPKSAVSVVKSLTPEKITEIMISHGLLKTVKQVINAQKKGAK